MAKVLLFSNVPVFTPDGIATGLGLRVWGLARSLATRGHDVTIAEPETGRGRRAEGGRTSSSIPDALCPLPSALSPLPPIVTWSGDPRSTRRLIESADVVVVQPTLALWPHFLRPRPRCLVVDLYNPVLVDCLTFLKPEGQGLHDYANTVACHLFFLRHGDVFLCAGERQRRYYTGALSLAGRLNPLTNAEELLRPVPMGCDIEPPVAPGERLLRGTWAPEDAELLLWPGGIYPWFDAVTVVRALARLRAERPRATLLFVGAENPLAGPLSSPGAAEAAEEALRLGLPPEAVRFAPWLPYHQRAAMYAEADLAVLAHKPLLEAEFSWRTRTLDCLWGGLPLVVTAGDEVGERAEQAGAACSVPTGDDAALAAALSALLADPERRAAMRDAARALATGALSWDRVTEPLHALCLDPRPAADRACQPLSQSLGRAFTPRCPIDGTARRWAYRVSCALRSRGVGGTLRRILNRAAVQTAGPGGRTKSSTEPGPLVAHP
jgi:glycosyltransferase involved in cell wall biosynthesis